MQQNCAAQVPEQPDLSLKAARLWPGVWCRWRPELPYSHNLSASVISSTTKTNPCFILAFTSEYLAYLLVFQTVYGFGECVKKTEMVVRNLWAPKMLIKPFVSVRVCVWGFRLWTQCIYISTRVTDFPMVVHPLISTEILGNNTEMRRGFEKEHLSESGEWCIKTEF